jgi:hypothetical protein
MMLLVNNITHADICGLSWRTFNDHTFALHPFRAGWMALERFCCILICIIANWRRLSWFYAYIVWIWELKRNTQNKAGLLCVCAHIYITAAALLLVAADAVGGCLQKESGPGKCKCVCECAKTERARSYRFLHLRSGAVLLCAEIKDNFICEQNKSSVARRAPDKSLSLSLSLSLMTALPRKSLRESCRLRPTALRVNSTCRTPDICN